MAKRSRARPAASPNVESPLSFYVEARKTYVGERERFYGYLLSRGLAQYVKSAILYAHHVPHAGQESEIGSAPDVGLLADAAEWLRFKAARAAFDSAAKALLEWQEPLVVEYRRLETETDNPTQETVLAAKRQAMLVPHDAAPCDGWGVPLPEYPIRTLAGLGLWLEEALFHHRLISGQLHGDAKAGAKRAGEVIRNATRFLDHQGISDRPNWPDNPADARAAELELMEVLRWTRLRACLVPQPHTALTEIRDDTLLAPRDIAQRFPTLTQSVVDGRLRRFRNANNVGWKEVPDRGSREAKYLYRFGSVKHLFQ